MAMNSEKISVIIPIYQVEKYLEKCIHSIIAQTYRNLEIILVDDGSTDASPAICDRFRSEDSRINVIHQANGGLSRARNVGLAAATGDYISFVDSDDWARTEHDRIPAVRLAGDRSRHRRVRPSG